MEYRIEIRIDFAKIKCSPHRLTIDFSDSEEGAIALYKEFEIKFGEDRVTLYEDRSQDSYRIIA